MRISDGLNHLVIRLKLENNVVENVGSDAIFYRRIHRFNEFRMEKYSIFSEIALRTLGGT